MQNKFVQFARSNLIQTPFRVFRQNLFVTHLLKQKKLCVILDLYNMRGRRNHSQILKTLEAFEYL